MASSARYRAFRIREKLRQGKKVSSDDAAWFDTYQRTRLRPPVPRGSRNGANGHRVAQPISVAQPDSVAQPVEVQTTVAPSEEVPVAQPHAVPETVGSVAGEGEGSDAIPGCATGLVGAQTLTGIYAGILAAGDEEAMALGAPIVFGPQVRQALVDGFERTIGPRVAEKLGDHADEKMVIGAPIVQRVQNLTIKFIRARREAAEAEAAARQVVDVQAPPANGNAPASSAPPEPQPPPAPRPHERPFGAGMTVDELVAQSRRYATVRR